MNLLREKQRAVGWHASCSDAPDTAGINQAAKDTAALGKDALEYYKERDRAAEPLRLAAAKRADEVSAAQLESMRTQTGLAKEASDYNRETFRPLERQVVTEAANFDTEAERERLAGLALGDVKQQFSSARAQGERSMARAGVNVSDGVYAGMNKDLVNDEALAGATAKNKARTGATTMGRAMKMDAISLGRGLPGQQATSTGLALSAGRGAVDTAQVPVQMANESTRLAGQGYGTAMQGAQASGNLYGQAANLESTNNDALWATAGKVAGAFMSDKNEKTGRKKVKPAVALSMARKMPVERWKYRKDSVANDGGKEHIGPMAQSVRAAAGDGVAPGGKQIDPISMAGVTLAAVQALDKKVTKLAKRRA